MSKKVFVTGATGLLGSHLCRSLIRKGYKIRASKRKNSKMDLVDDIRDKIDWVSGDVLEIPFLEEAINDVDWVFHCAAIVSFSPKERKKMMDINVQGTENIVNVCLHHQVEKLIHTSSIAAIGRPEKMTEPITENTKWEESKLNSAYAKSKFLAEMEVWRGYAEGLPVIIVNPSVILGRGYWDKGSSKLFHKVKNGLKFYPLGSTGFVDVRDVANAMILLAEANINGERFILNGNNTPYSKFLNLVASELNVKAPNIKVSPLLQALSWRVEKIKSLITGKSPLVTKETAQLSSLSYQYSNLKSLNAGVSYSSLEDTVKHTCHFLKSK